MDNYYFKKRSFEEADNLKGDCKTKSEVERLAAAAEMINAVYGLVGQSFKEMDQTYFCTKKRYGLYFQY